MLERLMWNTNDVMEEREMKCDEGLVVGEIG